jgi:general secretion pathway protein G
MTLMEVLLVLAILSVIAAMVVPQLIGRQQEAYIKATQNSIAMLENALKLYAQDHDGNFPATNEGLMVLIVPNGNDEQWKGPYLENDKELPKDAWGTEFQYEYPGKNNRMKGDILSAGPDRQFGTADDINNWAVGRR